MMLLNYLLLIVFVSQQGSGRLPLKRCGDVHNNLPLRDCGRCCELKGGEVTKSGGSWHGVRDAKRDGAWRDVG